MLEGRFTLGVGTGEALNEHILGDAWPEADVRLEMLEEAVEVMRALWTGDVGQPPRHALHAWRTPASTRCPTSRPPVLVSGFGPKAVDAGRADRRRLLPPQPDADVDRARSASKRRRRARPRPARRCAWAPTRTEARRTAHRLWPNAGLPGELAQVLPTAGALRAGLAAGHRGDDRRVHAAAAPTSSGTSRRCSRTSTPASTRSTCSRSATSQDAFFAMLREARCCRASASPAGCRTRIPQLAGPDAPRRNHLACWSSSRRSNGTQKCRSRYGASSRTVLKPAAVTIPPRRVAAGAAGMASNPVGRRRRRARR